MVLLGVEDNCKVSACMYFKCIGKSCPHWRDDTKQLVTTIDNHKDDLPVIHIDISDLPDDVLLSEIERRMKNEG